MIVPVPVMQEAAFIQQEADGRDAAAETQNRATPEPKCEAENPQSDGFWSGAAGIADRASTWRRTEPLQSETLRAGVELSMRQMTSMCFQASSKVQVAGHSPACFCPGPGGTHYRNMSGTFRALSSGGSLARVRFEGRAV